MSSAEQELANPAANLSAAASYEELARLLRMASVADKDKVSEALSRKLEDMDREIEKASE